MVYPIDELMKTTPRGLPHGASHGVSHELSHGMHAPTMYPMDILVTRSIVVTSLAIPHNTTTVCQIL